MSMNLCSLGLVLASFLSLVGGCVGHRGCTTAQTVVVSVGDVLDGNPVGATTVTIGQEANVYYDLFEGDDAYWIEYEEYSDVTSGDGIAGPTVVSAFLCPPNLDPEVFQDRLDEAIGVGECYIIRVGIGPESEVLSLPMYPGASVSGERYAVTILEIGEAHVTGYGAN